MKEKIKEHLIVSTIVTIFIYLVSSYINGSFNPFSLSKDSRETQIMVFIWLQLLINYCWFNREKILKQIKE